MTLSVTVRALVAAGATGEMILAVVEAHENAVAALPQAPERVWVYVMGVDHPDDNLVKVGISKHPNHRRETLEKERGLNLYVAHTEGPFTRSLASEIERQAHTMLAELRERGEWFLCGVERAADVVRDCAIGATI